MSGAQGETETCLGGLRTANIGHAKDVGENRYMGDAYHPGWCASPI